MMHKKANVLFLLLQAEWEACGVWQSRGGHQRCQGDREARHKEWDTQSQGCHRRQRRTQVVSRVDLLEPGQPCSLGQPSLISSMLTPSLQRQRERTVPPKDVSLLWSYLLCNILYLLLWKWVLLSLKSRHGDCVNKTPRILERLTVCWFFFFNDLCAKVAIKLTVADTSWSLGCVWIRPDLSRVTLVVKSRLQQVNN